MCVRGLGSVDGLYRVSGLGSMGGLCNVGSPGSVGGLYSMVWSLETGWSGQR